MAAAMGYEYVLIDNWWDNNIGRDRMEQFIKYARSKGVEMCIRDRGTNDRYLPLFETIVPPKLPGMG